jgi:hypothetical protein
MERSWHEEKKMERNRINAEEINVLRKEMHADTKKYPPCS